MSSILVEAAETARGERAPAHSAAAYRDAAIAWASRQARPEESPTVALARLCATGSMVVDLCYRAAAIAHALDTLDLGELVPPDAPDAANRLSTWAALLSLVEPHRALGERLNATLRRLLGENLAVRVTFLLILQEPGPKQ
ncbi:hypothetical protein L6V77_03550 [Myxococcota bacterium]|nr:hypothetical protein [Myxococcota bacterium]